MSAEEIKQRDALDQLPPSLRQWLDLEQYHLHKADFFQRPDPDHAFDVRYLSRHATVFRLPCYWVPRRSLHMFGSQLENADTSCFFSETGDRRRILFPIHPTATEHYQEFLLNARARDAADEGIFLWAIPTSSTRTVLAWRDGQPQSASFIKTSLHSLVFGDRRIQRVQAARSVGLSALVQADTGLPASLKCLPESLAFTARQAPGTGTIVRSIPDELRTGQSRAVPLFSLLGGDGERRPMLLTILERTGMSPTQFVHEVLCEPFADLWIELVLKHGLILESHGQDLMLQLSPELTFQRCFYYRDFEGMQVDWELRRRLGMFQERMPGDWSWQRAYNSWGEYPYAHLLWFKWRISLVQYLRLVLHEVETSMHEWQQAGLIGAAPAELTSTFSHYLFAALERMFGVRYAPYDVGASLNKFLRQLLELRRELLAGSALLRHAA